MLQNCPLGRKDIHACYWCMWSSEQLRCEHPNYTVPKSQPAAERLCHLTLTHAEASVVFKSLIRFQYDEDPTITDEQFELAQQVINKIAEVTEA